MDIKVFNTLNTILEEGSFQKAAQKLSYTQSTVTFQMQQLENEFGIQLFEKIGRKMILTQAGKDILPYIKDILIATAKIKNYGKSTPQLCGELRITMPETILIYKMQPIIQTFRSLAPNVKLILETQNCFSIRESIVSGYSDLGIHYDIGAYNAKVNIEKLSQSPLSLIVSPNLSKEFHDFINTNQRKSISYICNDHDCIYQSIFNNYLNEKNIIIESTLNLGSVEAIKSCVSSNIGISFLPSFVAKNEITNGELLVLDTDLRDISVTIVSAYHKNKWLSPAMKLFINILKKEMY